MADLFDNVSNELRYFPHWLVWNAENTGKSKLDKVPYSAISGNRADVTNTNNLTTFDRAVTFCRNYGSTGIGFVFNDQNDISGIDLDATDDTAIIAKQTELYFLCDSYSEKSPNNGLHIFVRGKIAGLGTRTKGIELYSRGRFFTVTGDVFRDKPIADRTEILNNLYTQLAGEKAINVQAPILEQAASQADNDIISQCMNAANGTKFHDLYKGEWSSYYPSQSEADFAFIDIVTFYTKNVEQIERIFKASQLGQRAKANRKDYISNMTRRAFDRTLAPVKIIGLEEAFPHRFPKTNGHAHFETPPAIEIETAPQYAAPEALPAGEPDEDVDKLPPGLLGAIASYIYTAAPRPVAKIALCAAITFLAGICGRSWNVSGTGLNHYTLLLANTGVGKEAMASGIAKLMYQVSQTFPAIREFAGPSELPSGIGIIRALEKKPCCFSILGEFGYRLQQLTSPRANPAEVGLRRVMLDLYNKSGFMQTLEPSAYSDSSKNYDVIHSPAWSFLGESIPSKFYNALDESMLADGFLPRCTIIEYKGLRPDLNENHINVNPDLMLIGGLAQIGELAHRTALAKTVINVRVAEDAVIALRQYEKQSTAYINSAQEDIIRELWNRAHIKVLRLSALVAVGVDFATPMITLENVQWAMRIINRDITKLSVRFVKGEIGGEHNTENQQLFEAQKHIRSYLTLPFNKIQPYSNRSDMHIAKVIPVIYLQKRLASTGVFMRDRAGATKALERTIKIMIDTDLIRRLTPYELAAFGTTMQCFKIQDQSWI